MRGEVLEMIGELRAAGTQFVLVTHEMAFARRVADEVAFIADGRVLAHDSSLPFFAEQENPRVRAFLAGALAS
jgi:polar amino acid transport system ATP-binding protein